MFRSYQFVLLFFFVIISYSCKKEGESTFTVPSTYRFNSPNLVEKSVYKIDHAGKKGILLTDSLGDFNRANSVISDSLNYIIRNSFAKNSLRSINFENGDKAILEFGRIDTTGGKNIVIPGEKISTKYSLSGNNIKFDGFPSYFAEITNSFLEVNLCQEFTFRSQRTGNGTHVKKYFHRDCTDTDHSKILTRIINENPSVIYDTISIERVNFIFSTY